MIRELQILDRELSKANSTILFRSDFQLFERNLVKEATAFLTSVERSATKKKRNDVILIAVVKS